MSFCDILNTADKRHYLVDVHNPKEMCLYCLLIQTTFGSRQINVIISIVYNLNTVKLDVGEEKGEQEEQELSLQTH